MFQSKKPKSLHDVRHARKLHLRTDPSRDTLCLRVLNTQLPRVIEEHAIHQGVVMDFYFFLCTENQQKNVKSTAY